MINWLLTFIAYGSIILAIVIIFKENTKCNQDCRQGRDCDCEDDNE